jgi:hypothetical protein
VLLSRQPRQTEGGSSECRRRHSHARNFNKHEFRGTGLGDEVVTTIFGASCDVLAVGEDGTLAGAK